MTVDPREAARFIDWVRLVQAPCRAGVVVRTVPGGWVSARPGIPSGEVPSAAGNRVYWQSPEVKLGAAEVAESLRVTRELGGDRTYFWIAPWACDAATERALADAGAERWPYVEYVALAKETEAAAEAPSPFTVRAVHAEELESLLTKVGPWYFTDGTVAMRRITSVAPVEIFAAFEGETPVALGLLFINGAWGYLGAAATDPAHRNRGAQKALIRGRVARALERGARWCAGETNTAVPVSLTNLAKCGFIPVIAWRVYGWTSKA